MVGSVMVIGGGIGGTQSALDLADSGFKVYLVDKSPAIGGVMSQLDKTFPTNDCAMCILSPKLVGAGRHPNIRLMTNTTVETVEGEVGNFLVTLRRKTRRVNEDRCTGCGVCAQKCPVEVPDEYNEGQMPRKAIYVKYSQAVPLVYTIDRKACIGCGICENECLARAIEYDSEDEFEEVNVGSLIVALGFDEFDPTRKSQFGYGVYRNVVSSIEFERMLSATGPYGGTVMRPSDGKIPQRLAFIQCVGSRDENTNPYCSGVCCMYAMKEAIIAKEHTPGVKPTIFYMDIRAFGKGFDEYYEHAKQEIRFVNSLVAEIQENPETGNLRLKFVEGGMPREEEFDMVVLSVGLEAPHDAELLAHKLKIELNEFNFAKTGVFSPVETSRKGIYVAGAFSGPKDIPDTVAQASAAAARAASVIQSERGTEITKVELPPERDVKEEEPRIGVFVCHCGINIGGVVDVPAVRDYAKTLPNVVYAEDNMYTCSQDTQERIKEKIREHRLNRVVVASCTPRTHEPLFQSTTREGGLNPYLFEMANIRDQDSWVHMHEPEAATEKAKDLVRMAAAKAALLEPLDRPTVEVTKRCLIVGGGPAGMAAALEIADQGYEAVLIERSEHLGGNLRHIHYLVDGTDPEAHLEDLIKRVVSNERIQVYTSTTLTGLDGFVGNFKSTLSNGMEIEHGTIIIATGGEEYTPKEGEFGWGNPNVLPQTQLEERLHNGDEKFKKPLTLAMIQCVGSRNERHPNCSRVCCTTAVKNALKLKELNPDAEIFIFYRDMRTYGFREIYYKLAGEKGVTFVKYTPERKPEVSAGKDGLSIGFHDMFLDRDMTLNPDYVVLSTGIVPQEDREELAQHLKVCGTEEGFYLEAHMKLRPVDFANEGMFLAGLAHSPKFIDEAISQAQGAAARACTILSKDEIETEAITAVVDEDRCSGCGICEVLCPYNAITMEDLGDNHRVSKVNPVLCKGCGTCVAACPSQAVEQQGFTTDEIFSAIDALAGEVRE